MGYVLSISTSETQNPAANTSTVSATMTITSTNGSYYYGMSTSYTIDIAGNRKTVAGPDRLDPNDSWSSTHTVTFNHSVDGFRGYVDTWADFTGPGGYSPGYLYAAGPRYAAINYTRLPNPPSWGSVSRTGSTLNVSINGGSSVIGASVTNYIERSQDNGATWIDQRTGTYASFTGLAQNSTQRFRAFTEDSEGRSAYLYSDSYWIPVVPSAPASISVSSISGRNITVAYTGSGYDGGTPITSYVMQYNNGSGWTGTRTVSSSPQTFSNLTAGVSYQFRIYATNEMGSSLYTYSDTVFLSSGGRRWNGSSFTPTTTAKRWNGTTWVDITTAKRWSGTAWVDLT